MRVLASTLRKRKLLRLLERHSYLRLMPSPIHGVGVFAIRDIPRGVDPFAGPPIPKWIRLSRHELCHVPHPVYELIDTYCVFEKGKYWIPEHGINCLDAAYFLNHSKRPNMVERGDGDTFVAKRRIRAGEELTVDYRTYGDPENFPFVKR